MACRLALIDIVLSECEHVERQFSLGILPEFFVRIRLTPVILEPSMLRCSSRADRCILEDGLRQCDKTREKQWCITPLNYVPRRHTLRPVASGNLGSTANASKVQRTTDCRSQLMLTHGETEEEKATS